MNTLKDYLGPARLPFLILTPAYVSLGIGTAYWSTGSVDAFLVILILIGAVASHLAVNAFNEYFDFKNGLDAHTIRTPFSGGSGSMLWHPGMDKVAWRLAWGSLIVTILIGLWFVWVRGWLLLPIGIMGVLIIYYYSPIISHYPALCMLLPGFAMGPLYVMGTNYVLTGKYSWEAAIVSLVPFFLLNSLLLQNQLPDVEADRIVGRRNIAITAGKKSGVFYFSLFFGLSYLVVLTAAASGLLPPLTLLSLLTLPAAVRAMAGVSKNFDNVPKMIPYMGITVIVNVIMPVIISLGMFFSR